MERLIIDRPVIVEGRYDKNKLAAVIDGNIIVTDGFGIFRGGEKMALIRRLAEKNGIIVLTDSDGAGLLIRNYFKSALPPEQLTQLYIPELPGKERRKKSPSKAGFLGVEGMETELLRRLFEPFAAGSEKAGSERTERRRITKLDFYNDGLSGGEGSAELRRSLLKKLGLPSGLSTRAMIEALNMLYTYEEYREYIKGL